MKSQVILTEPVEKNKTSSLLSFLNKATLDPQVYWQKKDDLALAKIKRRAKNFRKVKGIEFFKL